MNRFITGLGLAVLAMATAALLGLPTEVRSGEESADSSSDLLAELQNYRHKIVYETNRDGNWELYLCNADGSHPVNVTRTSDVDELFPKPSPDGTRICLVADEGKVDLKVRNIYYMNSDRTGRTKVASNGREPCWSPDGTKIAYMRGEFEKFTYFDAATKGLFLYDLKTHTTREHVNHKLHHLYTLGRGKVSGTDSWTGEPNIIKLIGSRHLSFSHLCFSGCSRNSRGMVSPELHVLKTSFDWD